MSERPLNGTFIRLASTSLTLNFRFLPAAYVVDIKMTSFARTMVPVLSFLHVFSKQLLTAHESETTLHSTGCSYHVYYVTKYCISCAPEVLGRTQLISLGLVNCSSKNLTEFPMDLPRTTGKLVLSHNMISRLNPEEMKRILYIKELMLEENDISFISEGTFQNNTLLESLHLGDNELNDVIPGTFEGLKNLLKLYLNRNRISILRTGTFQRLVSLNKLDLSRNEILVIEKGAFSGLKRLTHLNLAQNKLRKVFDFYFRKLVSLAALNLEFNSIGAFEDGCFSDLTLLQSLSASHNNLTSVSEGLNILGSLVFLDLSYNLVEFIPIQAFTHLKSLEFLDLSFSNIGVFHGILLKELLPNLKLYVHHNPLDCSCDLRWLKEWFDNSSHPNIPDHWSQVTCAYPNTLSGRPFMTLNITDLKCSCEQCQKSSMCVYSEKNCNCKTGWAGKSCYDSCEINVIGGCVSSQLVCSSSKEKCFCSNMSKACAKNAYLTCGNYSLPDCVCKSGYQGNGFLNCTDVDECANAHSLCHKYADCINTEGSFECSCRVGYVGDGVLCHSIKHHRTIAIATAVVSFSMFFVLVSILVFCSIPTRRRRLKEASSSRTARSGEKKKKQRSTRRYVDFYKIRELSFTNIVFRQGKPFKGWFSLATVSESQSES